MFKLPKNIFVMILGGMLIYHHDKIFSAHASSSTDDTGGVPLQTKTNPCRPIPINGKMVPTVPVYMPNFPVTLHGIKQHYVCKLSDITPPEVSGCPSNQTYTIPVGDSATTHTFTWTPPTATDDAGIESIVPDHASEREVTVDNPITVTYTVTDGSGLTNTDCSFTLTVLGAGKKQRVPVDSTPPVVSGCPSNQTYTVPVGDSTTTYTFTWTPPTATDDAGIASIVPDHASGLEVTLDNPITVTYTLTDSSGLNNTDCSFTLTVLRAVDITPPEVSGCPSDQTYTVPVGDSTTTHTFTWTPPTATDDAGIASIVPYPSLSQPTVSVAVNNSLNVTYTVTDWSGLTNTDCYFILTVLKAEPTTKMFVTSPHTDNFYKIFVAHVQDDLIFTHIPATIRPRYLAYDHMDRKIYWTARLELLVYRADVDGGNRENVTNDNGYDYPFGIAIAETSRILYIAYYHEHKITSVSIEEGSPIPGTESDFETGLTIPISLEVDEEQGYLYWTMDYWVYRKALDGTRNKEVVYQQQEQTLRGLTGLSIDLNRDPRRIFFCDYHEWRSFYKDLHDGTSVNDAVELTSYFTGDSDAGKYLGDISHFNGALYWAKMSNPNGIAIMTDYEFSNRSYTIKATSNIAYPKQLLIINMGP